MDELLETTTKLDVVTAPVDNVELVLGAVLAV
jgi:hypothetical protein